MTIAMTFIPTHFISYTNINNDLRFISLRGGSWIPWILDRLLTGLGESLQQRSAAWAGRVSHNGRSSLGGFHKWGYPQKMDQNGWFKMENPISIDDLGVPLFKETSIWKWWLNEADKKHVSVISETFLPAFLEKLWRSANCWWICTTWWMLWWSHRRRPRGGSESELVCEF